MFNSTLRSRFPSIIQKRFLNALAPKHSFSYEQGYTNVTKLSNGITVCTDPSVGETLGLGLFIKKGSRHETEETKHATNAIGKLALRRTKKHNPLERAQNLASIVGNFTVQAEREYILVNSIIEPKMLQTTMETFEQIIKDMEFVEKDLEEVKSAINFSVEKKKLEKMEYVPELIHRVAFNERSLGRSITMADKLDINSIQKFWNQHIIPENLMIVCAGGEHEEIVQLAEKSFGDLKSPKLNNEIIYEDPIYTGGNHFYPDSSLQFGNVGLGFKIPCALDLKSMFAFSVANQILGGGSSFSAGGPGKGMFTRLYHEVLSVYWFMESAFSQSFAYKDSSLFTIFGSSEPRTLPNVAGILADSIINLDRGITPEELQRAKNMIKSNVLMNVESRTVQVEDIGRQVMTYGSRMLAKDLMKSVDEIYIHDISRIKEYMLSHPVTLVTTGNFTSNLDCLYPLEKRNFKLSK
ncbi:LuxS/MPP-like metallohydrolase [Rozella allomycis CSF55]|uniref:LuxS/MPP-like metallohydrolase n=1 Tax=Rozella allomycis (strain CSF55) TaxID=988480 RepID=A0A4P9YMS2_ROZAC|nr:LuxS/MPP-like metallohydrolase [Rozella allomycis CSF55]